MPNWCDNRITVQGSIEELTKLADAIYKNGLLETLDPAFMIKVEEEETTAVERIERWGTRLVCEEEVDYIGAEELEIRFISAWSPADGLKDMLVSAGFDADIYFYEGGCDFVGLNDEEYSFSEGKWINNESLWNMFSQHWIDHQEYLKEMEVDAA